MVVVPTRRGGEDDEDGAALTGTMACDAAAVADGERSMAPSPRAFSGHGSLSNPGEGFPLVPFPQRPTHSNDHRSGARATKFRPWRFCSVQKGEKVSEETEKKTGEEKKGDGGGERKVGGDLGLGLRAPPAALLMEAKGSRGGPWWR